MNEATQLSVNNQSLSYLLLDKPFLQKMRRSSKYDSHDARRPQAEWFYEKADFKF